jgi:hypothetical protein
MVEGLQVAVETLLPVSMESKSMEFKYMMAHFKGGI